MIDRYIYLNWMRVRISPHRRNFEVWVPSRSTRCTHATPADVHVFTRSRDSRRPIRLALRYHARMGRRYRCHHL